MPSGRGPQAAELAFLPAALELEHTPPAPLARGILWLILAAFVAALVWAVIGHVDVVATAEGKVVPAGQVKTVQAVIGGAVSAIHVSDGAAVVRGALLLELDAREARAAWRQLVAERQQVLWNAARLETLLERLNGVPQPAQQQLPAPVLARMSDEFAAFQAAARALGEEQRAHRGERQHVIARLTQLEATLPLLGERTAALATLARRALAPRNAWLELEERRLGAAHQRAVLNSEMLVSDARSATLVARSAALRARTAAEWRAELDDQVARSSALDLALEQARSHLAQHQLRAPVGGIVQQLAIHTVGAVVTVAEPLLVVVPSAAANHIEAWVKNQDVGFVRVGQPAAIKVHTFPFTTYGMLRGRVDHITPDAIAHEQLGLVYQARVSLDRGSLQRAGLPAALSPGMAVSVDLGLGRRRMIEFLLAPLLRYRSEAWRER